MVGVQMLGGQMTKVLITGMGECAVQVSGATIMQ